MVKLTEGVGRNEGWLSPDGDRLTVLHGTTTELPDLLTGRVGSDEIKRVTVSGTDSYFTHALATPTIVSFPHQGRAADLGGVVHSGRPASLPARSYPHPRRRLSTVRRIGDGRCTAGRCTWDSSTIWCSRGTRSWILTTGAGQASGGISERTSRGRWASRTRTAWPRQHGTWRGSRGSIPRASGCTVFLTAVSLR